MFGGDSVGKEAASKQATRHDETNSLLREGNDIARSSLANIYRPALPQQFTPTTAATERLRLVTGNAARG